MQTVFQILLTGPIMTSRDKSVLLSKRYMLNTMEANELVRTTLDNYNENGCDVCGEVYHSFQECGCTEVEINLYLDYIENEEMN